jgi:hypothetical protein
MNCRTAEAAVTVVSPSCSQKPGLTYLLWNGVAKIVNVCAKIAKIKNYGSVT